MEGATTPPGLHVRRVRSGCDVGFRADVGLLRTQGRGRAGMDQGREAGTVSRAGIGKALACLQPHAGWIGERGSANPEPVIGALVFVFNARPPDGQDAEWMRWGALLMLHADLDPETAAHWMHADAAAPWSAQALRDATYLRVAREAMRRHEEVHHAELLLETRAMDLQAGKIRNYRGEQIVRAARSRVSAAKEDDWPRGHGEVLGRIADGVLAELHADERCPQCDGAGIIPHVLDEHRCPIPCPACYGTTYTRWSDRERARTIDVLWSAFKRSWKRPYEWLYGQAMSARTAAVREFRLQTRG